MYTYCIISTQIKVQKCLPTVSHQKCRQIYIIISTQMKTCLKPDRIFAVAYRHVVWCVCWARIVQSVLRLQQKVHNITTVELYHFLAYNNKLHGIYNFHCYFNFRTRRRRKRPWSRTAKSATRTASSCTRPRPAKPPRS